MQIDARFDHTQCRYFIKLFLISNIIFILSTKVYADVDYNGNLTDTVLPLHVKDSVNSPKQTDIYDLIKYLFHVNLRMDSLNKKGMGPFVSAVPSVGYTLQSGFTWAITQSTSFYTNPDKNKISSITGYLFYSQYNQYGLDLNSNVYFEEHNLHIFGDWRFYKFPTYTFGLGNYSTLSQSLWIDYNYVRFYQYIYQEFYKNFYIGLGYNLDVYWNITTKADTGNIYKEFIKNVKDSRVKSSGFSLNFLYDDRKSSINSKKGTYLNIQYRPNLILLGSDLNWQSMLIDCREYFRLPASSDNVLAFWSYNNLTLKRQPAYLNLPTLGWDDYNNTGRGYVQGRFTGNNLVYLESEYRFHVTDNGLFGGVVFGNLESIVRNINSGIQTIIPGYGLGIRIKFNKDSDTNVAVDYGIGIGGSHGFFFNLGEVF